MVRFEIDLDTIYPIGSIYMSINSTNPKEYYGGEWERIEDKFLLACGTKHPNGEEDGSEDAVVVSHNHTQDAHTHSPTGSRKYIAVGNVNWAYASTRQAASSGSTYFPYSDKNTDGITEQNATTSAQPYIYYKGESGTGKNMPPFLAVYMWVRTG